MNSSLKLAAGREMVMNNYDMKVEGSIPGGPNGTSYRVGEASEKEGKK